MIRDPITREPALLPANHHVEGGISQKTVRISYISCRRCYQAQGFLKLACLPIVIITAAKATKTPSRNEGSCSVISLTNASKNGSDAKSSKSRLILSSMAELLVQRSV